MAHSSCLAMIEWFSSKNKNRHFFFTQNKRRIKCSSVYCCEFSFSSSFASFYLFCYNFLLAHKLKYNEPTSGKIEKLETKSSIYRFYLPFMQKVTHLFYRNHHKSWISAIAYPFCAWLITGIWIFYSPHPSWLII